MSSERLWPVGQTKSPAPHPFPPKQNRRERERESKRAIQKSHRKSALKNGRFASSSYGIRASPCDIAGRKASSCAASKTASALWKAVFIEDTIRKSEDRWPPAMRPVYAGAERTLYLRTNSAAFSGCAVCAHIMPSCSRACACVLPEVPTKSARELGSWDCRMP
eukprot:scaffold3424_cov256-Pinguiococcus_pyrenoidosus.AAC.1